MAHKTYGMDEQPGTPWYEEPHSAEITPEQQREELLDAIIAVSEQAMQAVRRGDTGPAILYIRAMKSYAKKLKENRYGKSEE